MGVFMSVHTLKVWLLLFMCILAASQTQLSAQGARQGITPDWFGEYPSPAKPADGIVSFWQAQYGDEVDIGFRLLKTWPGQSMTISLVSKAASENLVAIGTIPSVYILDQPGYQRVASFRALDRSLNWHPQLSYNWRWGRQHAAWTASPLPWPWKSTLPVRILQGHDGNFSHFGDIAKAIDFDLAEGEPLFAVRGGLVTSVTDHFNGAGLTPDYKQRTNGVEILHSDGTVSRYFHIQQGSAKVKPGQQVSTGDQLARNGNVGYSGGPHLHFDVMRPVDGFTMESIPVSFANAGNPVIPLQGILYDTGKDDPWYLAGAGFYPINPKNDWRPWHQRLPSLKSGQKSRLVIPIAQPLSENDPARTISITLQGPPGSSPWNSEWPEKAGWFYSYIDWTPAVAGRWQWTLSRNGSMLMQGTIEVR